MNGFEHAKQLTGSMWYKVTDADSTLSKQDIYVELRVAFSGSEPEKKKGNFHLNDALKALGADPVRFVPELACLY